MKYKLYIFSLTSIVVFITFLSGISWGVTKDVCTLRPPLALSGFSEEASNMAEPDAEEVTHDEVNEHLRRLIDEARVVEVSFEGPENKPVQKMLSIKGEGKTGDHLSHELVSKLQEAKNALDEYYSDFKKFMDGEGTLSGPCLYYYGNFVKVILKCNVGYEGVVSQIWRQNRKEALGFADKRFLELLKNAKDAKINVVLGTPYVMEKGRVLSHARRDVSKTDMGFAWSVGGWLLDVMEPRKIHREKTMLGDTRATIVCALLDEGLHFGNEKVHGEVHEKEDFDSVIQHDKKLKRELTEFAEHSLFIHASFYPLYEGKMVGRDASMERIFGKVDRIKKDKTNDPVLIVGPTGSGKSLLAETFAEKPYAVDAGVLSTLSGDRMVDAIVEGIRIASEGASDYSDVFIINNFENDKEGAVQRILFQALSERKIQDKDGNEVEVKCRIIITAITTIAVGLEDNFLGRFSGNIVEIPPLYQRGEDIVLLAEYFNRQFSRDYEIPWVPINEFMGKNLQRLGEKDIKAHVRDIRGLMKEVIRKRAEIINGDFEKKGDVYYDNRREDIITASDFSLAYYDSRENKALSFIHKNNGTAWINPKMRGSGVENKEEIFESKPYFDTKLNKLLMDLAKAPADILLGPDVPSMYTKEEVAPAIDTLREIFEKTKFTVTGGRVRRGVRRNLTLKEGNMEINIEKVPVDPNTGWVKLRIKKGDERYILPANYTIFIINEEGEGREGFLYAMSEFRFTDLPIGEYSFQIEDRSKLTPVVARRTARQSL